MHQRIQHRHQCQQLIGPDHLGDAHEPRHGAGNCKQHHGRNHPAQQLKPLQRGLKMRIIALFGLHDLLLQPQGRGHFHHGHRHREGRGHAIIGHGNHPRHDQIARQQQQRGRRIARQDQKRRAQHGRRAFQQGVFAGENQRAAQNLRRLFPFAVLWSRHPDKTLENLCKSGLKGADLCPWKKCFT